MAVRLNGTQLNRATAPVNQALTNIAQTRIDNTVSRAVARHAAAIRADGSQIYLWLRSNAGLICTCRQPPAQLTGSPTDNSKEGLRDQPYPTQTGLPSISSRDSDFHLIPQRGINGVDIGYEQNIPADFVGIANETYAEQLDSNPQQVPQDLRALAMLSNELTDQQLAVRLSEGAAVYGGDKTACGICFGTGRTHGYDLATGKRLLLDASQEFNYSLDNANIIPASYPRRFQVNCNGSVTWLVDLPSYTNGWLNFTVRDNLQPANNLLLEWYYRHHWQPLTVAALAQSEGSDRTQTPIRVRLNPATGFELTHFTHVELIYASTEPLWGQSPPLSLSMNYEVAEPLITTEFEILASINDIPRESVFQDSKFTYLWKVLEVTPKMTARGQVFSLTVNARMVHRSEALYALKVIFDPQVTVHYRGLEVEEGGLEVKEIIPDSTPLRWSLRTDG